MEPSHRLSVIACRRGARLPVSGLLAVSIVSVAAGWWGRNMARLTDLGLAVRAGLSGGVAFLIIDLLMDALGWRVGGLHAGERATMVMVTTSGTIGAALAAGGALGRRL